MAQQKKAKKLNPEELKGLERIKMKGVTAPQLRRTLPTAVGNGTTFMRRSIGWKRRNMASQPTLRNCWERAVKIRRNYLLQRRGMGACIVNPKALLNLY